MNVEVVVIRERCKGCGICVAVCQTEVLELSKEENSRGVPYPIAVKKEHCLNCGLCEMFCPDFAIWATSEIGEEEAGRES